MVEGLTLLHSKQNTNIAETFAYKSVIVGNHDTIHGFAGLKNTVNFMFC